MALPISSFRRRGENLIGSDVNANIGLYNTPILELPGLYAVESDKKQHFQSMMIRGFILIFDATPMSQMAGHNIMAILRKFEGKPIISLSLTSLDCML
jgi:hypothetical protein